MNKLLFQSGVLLLLLTLMSTGQAQDERYIPVYCDQGHSLQKAIDRATEGALIDVWGTCHEAVLIQKDHIHLQGTNGATIIPPAGSTAFFVIFTDNVHITGFKIQGGARGVAIAAGSSARIIGNEILDSTSVGIHITGNSFAGVRDNFLRSTSGNFSQIFADSSSHANVFNNIITASSGSGIDAVFASSVTAGGNNVSGTAGFGLQVQQNAHMFLPSPNTVNNPGGHAISCGLSGGLRVDAVQNTTGTVSLDPHCDVTDFFNLFPG